MWRRSPRRDAGRYRRGSPSPIALSCRPYPRRATLNLTAEAHGPLSGVVITRTHGRHVATGSATGGPARPPPSRRLLIRGPARRASPAPAAFPGLSFAWLAEGRLAEYERLRPGHAGQAASRLRAGDRCFGAWLDDELVAVRWIATRAVLI